MLSFRHVADRRPPAPGTFEHFGRALDRCESFIERRFLVALLFTEEFPFEAGDDDVVATARVGPRLLQQVTLLAYRLDFVFEDDAGEVRLCIELDGHDFHDRTPEQAERDRARDRRLLREGWTTVRYTGREVVRDPMRCAREAVEIFERLRERRGPGLAKAPAPVVLACPPDESGTHLLDDDATWEAELAAARLASEAARKRHRVAK